MDNMAEENKTEWREERGYGASLKSVDAQGSIFEAKDFVFPYLYKFPGQDKQERILFVTREDRKMLLLRKLGVVLVASMVIIILMAVANWLLGMLNNGIGVVMGIIIAALVTLGMMMVAWWWIGFTWKRTIGLVTTYRLIKLVQITPWTKRLQTLPIKEIVDTSSETRNVIQAVLGISTLTARSSATSSGIATNDLEQGLRVNKKYFYFEHIRAAEDLEHYLNKLLHVLPEVESEKLMSFRPFIADLKGEKRRSFMEGYPEYWS